MSDQQAENLFSLPPLAHFLLHCFLVERDECDSGQHNCDENAICTNTVRGHSCTCKPGYVGNGTICRGGSVSPTT